MPILASSLTAYDEMVDSLRRGLSATEHGLKSVPHALMVVIRDGMWRERIIVKTGQVQRFERFIDFVTTPPLEGLGADVPTLERLCQDDPEALDLLDQAVRGKPGGDHRSEQFNRDNVTLEAPRGNSARGSLARLRKDRPDLHAEVLAGRLSPHAAMVAAGFRERTVSIPVGSERTAATLARHFDRATLIAAVQLSEAQS